MPPRQLRLHTLWLSALPFLPQPAKDIAIATDAQGFTPNKGAATQGGKISGDARQALEVQTGKRVVSRKNFLPNKGTQKQLPESNDG